MVDTDVSATLALQGWERAWDIDSYFAGEEPSCPDDPLTFCEPPGDSATSFGPTFCEIGCQTEEKEPDIRGSSVGSEAAREPPQARLVIVRPGTFAPLTRTLCLPLPEIPWGLTTHLLFRTYCRPQLMWPPRRR
jgi:hypothetical protein